MTWIRTVPLTEADEKLRRAVEAQKALYPQEYATPVHPLPTGRPASSPRTASSPIVVSRVRDIRRAHGARPAAHRRQQS